jgi:SpoVK/Ycf46/Vps4 family AAA+-type ATPase
LSALPDKVKEVPYPVVAALEDYSASDIKLLVDEAARIALKRKELIQTGTLLAALERVPASVTA